MTWSPALSATPGRLQLPPVTVAVPTTGTESTVTVTGELSGASSAVPSTVTTADPVPGSVISVTATFASGISCTVPAETFTVSVLPGLPGSSEYVTVTDRDCPSS